MKRASASKKRFHLFPRALFQSALLLSIATPAKTLAEAEAQSPLAYLYIDANAGGSSGGHSAIRINDEVYHFQHTSGIARLIKEPWNTFRYTYTHLENRTIESAELAATPQTAEQIRQSLSRILMNQNRHFDYLKALENDVAFLEAIHSGLPLRLSGAGFFRSKKAQHPWFEPLRQAIALPSPTEVWPTPQSNSDLQENEIADIRGYPLYPPTFSEQLTDQYDRNLALTTIAEDLEVAPNMLLDLGPIPKGPLGQKIKQHLRRFQQDLANGINALIQTPYPGHAPSLLLALARYQLIAKSLENDRIYVLDATPETTKTLKEETPPNLNELNAQSRFLARLSQRTAAIIKEDLGSVDVDDIRYHRVEIAATELAILKRAIQMKIRAKFPDDRGPPLGNGSVLIPLTQERSRQEGDLKPVETARLRLEKFKDVLSRTFRYGLLDRNCVTELIRSVNQSFDAENEASALGGHIAPDKAQSYIPFRFHELVKNRYRVIRITHHPSYLVKERQRIFAQTEIFNSEAFLEASPLTSSVYQQRLAEDGAFLFFSDNQFTLRPLIGSMNFVYGVGATVVGSISAPLDGGTLVMAGLQGMLFSLPELAFWNIRKGTFSEFALPADIAAQPHE